MPTPAAVARAHRWVLVVCLSGFVLAATAGYHYWGEAGPPMPWYGWAWLVAAALPLLWRHRYPLLVYLTTAALVLGYYTGLRLGGPAMVLAIVALFALARQRGLVQAGIAAAATEIAWTAASALTGNHAWYTDPRLLGMGAFLAAVVALGAVARTRQGYLTARREQAEERARRLAEAERLSIAREVHDVVAHSLAMINVQAGVAAHVADRRPEKAVEALLAIKEASRAALADLRATLGVLRTGEGTAPTPGLARMSELTAPVEAAGVPVRVTGEPGDLPSPVDVAAYRIVQESLTNALRYATGATAVEVRFDRRPAGLDLVIRDDGRAGSAPSQGSGAGIPGMRERAQALGGELVAGPASGGGFEVRAHLPVRGETP